MTEPYMLDFMFAMKRKLEENSHKGNRPAWLKMKKTALFEKLHGELEELTQAILIGTPQEIISECADVANYAMMIADNARRDIK